eukprot:gene15530-17398_t
MRRSPSSLEHENTQNYFETHTDYCNLQNSRANEEVVREALESKDTNSKEGILFGGNTVHDDLPEERKNLEEKQVREPIHLSSHIEFGDVKVNSAGPLFKLLSRCFFQKNTRLGRKCAIKCFASHSWGARNETHIKVEKIVRAIEKNQANLTHYIEVWLDSSNLYLGDEINPEIIENIKDSSIFLVFLDAEYQDKCLEENSYIHTEFTTALQQNKIILFIPLEINLSSKSRWKGQFRDLASRVADRITVNGNIDFDNPMELEAFTE